MAKGVRGRLVPGQEAKISPVPCPVLVWCLTVAIPLVKEIKQKEFHELSGESEQFLCQPESRFCFNLKT